MTIKKAVLLGSLGAILVGLTAFALSNPKYRKNITQTYADNQETAVGNWLINNQPQKMTKYNTIEYSSWYFGDTTPTANETIITWNVNGTWKADRGQNGGLQKGNFDKIQIIQNSNYNNDLILQVVKTVNSNLSNTYPIYNFTQQEWIIKRYIELNDGQDINNTNLKSFLTNNATQSYMYIINYTTNTITTGKAIIFSPINITYRKGYGTTNDYVIASNYTSWTNENYRILKITGGTEATNLTFINWLKNNSTKITLTTLDNTFWQLNQYLPEITAGFLSCNIDIYYNGYTTTGLQLGYSGATTQQANTIRYGGTIVYQNNEWIENTTNTYFQNSRIIIKKANNSNDEQNLQLIVWLMQNAQQYKTISTLYNTQWQLVESPNVNITKNIEVNFTSNGENFTNLEITDNKLKYRLYNGENIYNTYDVTYKIAYDTYWTNNNYRKITIIDGEGVSTNATSSISWFFSNGTSTSFTPIPTGQNDYDIENGNFTSLQSLMLRILTLPFTFIAQAFDITLWPNTAWEFNLSNFILAIIAIATILFIIKVFTSGFAVIGNYTGHPINTHYQNKKLRSETKLNNAKTEQTKKTKPNEKTIYRR